MCGAEFDTAELRTVGDARVCAPCDDKFGDALWELVIRRRRAVDAVEAGAALALSLLQLFAPPG